MDFKQLERMVTDWHIQQPQSSNLIIVTITISHKGVETQVSWEKRIRDCLKSTEIRNSYTKNLLSRTEDNLIAEFRKNHIKWHEATLTDFLTVFPTQEKFAKVKNSGVGSISLMKRVLDSHNREWPDK